jgi:hypothetical protein
MCLDPTLSIMSFPLLALPTLLLYKTPKQLFMVMGVNCIGIGNLLAILTTNV